MVTIFAGVGCVLVNMGWMNTTGGWNWTQTWDDIHSLPQEVASNVGGIKECVDAKVEVYRTYHLNWDTCKSTYAQEEKNTINMILRLASFSLFTLLKK